MLKIFRNGQAPADALCVGIPPHGIPLLGITSDAAATPVGA